MLTKIHQLQKHIQKYPKGRLKVYGDKGTGKTFSAAHRLIRFPNALGLAPTATSFNNLLQQVETYAKIGDNTQVYTIHGFCRLLAEDIGLIKRVLDFPELCAFVEQHISSISWGQYQHRSFADTTKMTREGIGLFQQLAAQSISPEAYLGYVKKSQEIELDNQDYRKQIEHEDFVRSQNDLAHAYETYRELLRKYSVTDWSGLVMDLTTTLDQNPYMVKQICTDYPHLIIDDAHLMSPAMQKFKNQLTAASTHESCTEFFRAFSKKGHAERDEEIEPNGEIVVLKKNYRSDISIQKAAEIVVTGREITAEEAKAMEKSVRCLQFEDMYHESQGIASIIKHKIQENPAVTIAVLCPSDEDIMRIAEFIREKGIAVDDNRSVHMYSEKTIGLIMALLHVIVNPDDSKYLYELLVSDLFNFPSRILAHIMSSMTRKRESLRDSLENFCQMEEVQLSSIGDIEIRNAKTTILKILKTVDKYRDLSVHLKSAELIRQFLAESGILEQLLDPQSADEERASQTLARFLQFVSEAEQNAEAPQATFVAPILFRLRNYPFDISLQENDYMRPNVSVLRIRDHASLEADCVIFAVMRDTRFPGSFRRNSLPFPIELFQSEFTTSRDEYLHESQKTLYSSFLQARHQVLITIAETYENPKRKVKPSRLLNPFFKRTEKVPAGNTQPIAANLTQHLINENIPDPKADEPWISFSQVDQYQRCPYRYYLSRVLKVATNPSPALIYGSSLHAAVAAGSIAKLEGKSLEECQKLARTAQRTAWEDKYFNSPEQSEHFFCQGQEAIQVYMEREFNTAHSVRTVEQPFEVFVPEANILLKGVWDRIESEDVLVEYKSNPNNRENRIKYHQNSLQLQIYCLAYRLLHETSPSCARLEMIESGDSHTFIPSASTDKQAIQVLQETTQNIRDKKFQPTPSFFGCRYCEYSDVCEHSTM